MTVYSTATATTCNIRGTVAAETTMIVQGGGTGNVPILDLRDGSGNQRMVFHQNGKVGIGNTAPNELLCVGGQTSANHIVVDSSSSTQNGFVWRSAGTTKWNITRTSSNNAYRIRMYDYGESREAVFLTSGDTSWQTGSDERLKKDIVDAESRLDDLLKIKVRRFKWKSNNKEDISFIAQELNEHCPEAVNIGNDEVWEEDNLDQEKKGDLKTPWGVSREKLIPMMVKSIQELSAKNDALETTVATLEAVENDSSSSNSALEQRIIALEAA